jgi:hypothetical protein
MLKNRIRNENILFGIKFWWDFGTLTTTILWSEYIPYTGPVKNHDNLLSS